MSATRRAELDALAARVAASPAEQQLDVLGDVWDALGPMTRPSSEQARRFAIFLDAGAYDSAAAALVPPRMQYGAGRDNIVAGPAGWAWVTSDESYDIERASTPALALAAAAVRAWRP